MGRKADHRPCLGGEATHRFPVRPSRGNIRRVREDVNRSALAPNMSTRSTARRSFIAFIEQPDVIEKILTHLGLWPAPAHSPPVLSIAA